MSQCVCVCVSVFVFVWVFIITIGSVSLLKFASNCDRAMS